MSVIATSANTMSNVLIHAYRPELGYTMDVARFDASSDGSVAVGDVELAKDGSKVTAAADVFGVALENVSWKSGEHVEVLVLVKGPATVRRKGINFGALVAADVEALLVSRDIQFLDSAALES